MKNEKKLYEEPKTEVICFAQADVISTSGNGGGNTDWRKPVELEEIPD